MSCDIENCATCGMCHMTTDAVMRRTKIVATLGPSSRDEEILRKMIVAGVNIVRENFSHGTAEDHRRSIELVRKIAKEVGQPVGIMADLQGPKIRVSRFKNKKIMLQDGAEFTIDTAWPKDAGDEHIVGTDYQELAHDLKANDTLLLNDGNIILSVKAIEGTKVICRVIAGGELSDNKGINKEGGGLSAPALTEKDKEDLKTAVSLNVDYMAISFPRCAEDMLNAKRLIAQAGGTAGVVAKVERIEAIVPETLDEIINASDAIMVARGDLAIEIGDANVPAAQKLMIRRARALNKPVITATQMMESMIHGVAPTRAEVSDVANAVFDTTDCVMLSAETAAGDHPDLVIKAMSRVCLAAEKEVNTQISSHRLDQYFATTEEGIAMSAIYAANHMDVKAIICLTTTGKTPLLMSRLRTSVPIFGLSNDERTLGKMTMYRDVYPISFAISEGLSSDKVMQMAIGEVAKYGLLNYGDTVIITNGMGVGKTNSLTIVKIDY